MLKIVSWNVNGLRTRIIDDKDAKQFNTKTTIESNSHLGKLVNEYNPDIICFSETRCSLDTTTKFQIPGYFCYYNSSGLIGARAGNRYSGVGVWTKIKPNQIITELPYLPTPNNEGRFIALYFDTFILINVYQPNSGTNFDYRITEWDPAMAQYLKYLKDNYDIPIIWTGDLNVARNHYDVFFGDIKHQYRNLDISRWNEDKFKQQETKYLDTPLMKGIGDKALPGFTIEERHNFREIMELGFIDVWRYLNPDTKFNGYTWWNMRRKMYRQLNRGWRIDYFLIDDKHKDKIIDCQVFKHIGETNDDSKIGSDHAPIGFTFKLLLG